MSNLWLPDFRLPHVGLPDFRLPHVRLSYVGLPDLGLSYVRLPDFRLPHVRLSYVGLPHVGLSHVRLSYVGLPHGDRGYGPMRAVLALFAVGCAEMVDPGTAVDTGPLMATGVDGPGAFDPGFEDSADFFTLMAGPVDGSTVHGTVQIWYSENARETIAAGSPFVVPEGTVSVKIQDNGAPAITVMVKKPAGFDPQNNDWSYEQRSIDGVLNNEGAIPACIGCHGAFVDSDFLGGTELR